MRYIPALNQVKDMNGNILTEHQLKVKQILDCYRHSSYWDEYSWREKAAECFHQSCSDLL